VNQPGAGGRKHNRGATLQVVLFFIATVGITATASIGIYKAYQEFVVKPREPSEVERLRSENRDLAKRRVQLEQQVSDLARRNAEQATRLWQEEVMNYAAQIRDHQAYLQSLPLEERAFAQAHGDLDSRRIVERLDEGLLPTDEERRLERLRSALKTVRDAVVGGDARSLPVDWSASTIEHVAKQLPTYESALETYAREVRVRASEVRVEKGAVERAKRAGKP
jgi:hypothetical protein